MNFDLELVVKKKKNLRFRYDRDHRRPHVRYQQ